MLKKGEAMVVMQGASCKKKEVAVAADKLSWVETWQYGYCYDLDLPGYVADFAFFAFLGLVPCGAECFPRRGACSCTSVVIEQTRWRFNET